jgi:hypothetical protein
MNSEKFFTWCRVAVKGIKYRPDRDAVHAELYEHLEDRYESFRCRGLAHEESIDKTLEAMGSAEELAPLLAKAHRPFWAYMLWVSRVLLIIAIAITVLPLGQFIRENNTINASFGTLNLFHEYDPYADSEYIGEFKSAKRMLYLEPNCTARIDSYTVRVTKAAQWRHDLTNWGPNDWFYIRLEATNPFPWEELDQNIAGFFWAEDSLGNHYYSNVERTYTYNESYVAGYRKISGLFSHIVELTLVKPVSQDARWIDLHYDRDGRNFVLRIDLTGGENP